MKKIFFIIFGLILLISPVLADSFLISIPSEIPSYYIVDMGEDKIVNEYTIRLTNSVNGSWNLRGSTDLESWNTLDSRANISLTQNVLYDYSISSPDLYRYYMFYFEEGFSSPSTNMDLNLYISPFSLTEGNITVYDRADNFIFWLWNPENISAVMIDDEFIVNPSAGYFIYSDLKPFSVHRITLYFNNGTGIFTDTYTDDSAWGFLGEFIVKWIWVIVAIILMILSLFIGETGLLALIAMVINFSQMIIFLNTETNPLFAIIAGFLGVVALLVSKFKVI